MVAPRRPLHSCHPPHATQLWVPAGGEKLIKKLVSPADGKPQPGELLAARPHAQIWPGSKPQTLRGAVKHTGGQGCSPMSTLASLHNHMLVHLQNRRLAQPGACTLARSYACMFAQLQACKIAPNCVLAHLPVPMLAKLHVPPCTTACLAVCKPACLHKRVLARLHAWLFARLCLHDHVPAELGASPFTCMLANSTLANSTLAQSRACRIARLQDCALARSREKRRIPLLASELQ